MSRGGCHGGISCLLVGIAALVIGCGPVAGLYGPADDPYGSQVDPSTRLTGIPFYPQEALQCGPAALASVLHFWGQPVTPEEIASRIYSRHLRGTLPLDMEEYAETYDGGRLFSVQVIRDQPGVFREEIMSGHPLVIFVDLGIWIWKKGHFMVLVGYNDTRGGVIAHSGKDAEKFIPYPVFLHQWAKTGYWALRIVPSIRQHES